MGRSTQRYRVTDLGREARCSKCGDFWPCDSEFYFMQKGVAHTWCKACYKADPKIRAARQREAENKRKGPPKPPQPFCTTHLNPGLLMAQGCQR